MQAAATVEKAIDLLFALQAHGEPLGVTRLGQLLGLPKSSTHRLLAALARRQLVEREAGGRYRPGMGLVALGLGSLRSDPLVRAARPLLEATSQSFGETAFLVGVRGTELIVLDKVEGAGFLRAAPVLGSTLPAHGTAVGKLLHAFGDAAPLPDELVAHTGRTLTDPEAFAAEVATARERGYAESREEWIPGLAVVAAPLCSEGRMFAALAVASSLAQLERHGFAALGRHLGKVAGEIEQRLLGSRA